MKIWTSDGWGTVDQPHNSPNLDNRAHIQEGGMAPGVGQTGGVENNFLKYFLPCQAGPEVKRNTFDLSSGQTQTENGSCATAFMCTCVKMTVKNLFLFRVSLCNDILATIL